MQPELMMMESNDENKTPDIPCCQPQTPVLAELLCSEVSDHDLIESGARSLEHCDEEGSVMSYFDPAVLHHPEVMSRLKFLESQIETPKSYFHSDGETEILPFMRKVVASWMLEVSVFQNIFFWRIWRECICHLSNLNSFIFRFVKNNAVMKLYFR